MRAGESIPHLPLDPGAILSDVSLVAGSTEDQWSLEVMVYRNSPTHAVEQAHIGTHRPHIGRAERWKSGGLPEIPVRKHQRNDPEKLAATPLSEQVFYVVATYSGKGQFSRSQTAVQTNVSRARMVHSENISPENQLKLPGDFRAPTMRSWGGSGRKIARGQATASPSPRPGQIPRVERIRRVSELREAPVRPSRMKAAVSVGVGGRYWDSMKSDESCPPAPGYPADAKNGLSARTKGQSRGTRRQMGSQFARFAVASNVSTAHLREKPEQSERRVQIGNNLIMFKFSQQHGDSEAGPKAIGVPNLLRKRRNISCGDKIHRPRADAAVDGR
ncbi:hypothetical protein DFH07DRAFT_764637 [Mycena maculata]|uniref:Uncharacterized protein n=1 Tax=Mycena maculata TaxID=230809 RepID=A0AAD7KC09_9AGAR|nr:hypothetical protein DFH07DRAFT_764637 [Mycena maculata]